MMAASATVRTATRIVIGRLIAVSTSHIRRIPSRLTEPAEETVAGPLLRQQHLTARATHPVSPAHHRSPLVSRFALPQQLQRCYRDHSDIEHSLVGHRLGPRLTQLGCSEKRASRPPKLPALFP